MESFGAILREKREEKNITIVAAARDTVISRHYIEALEAENIEVFPGNTYAVGFLRNYSEYLGLDANHMLQLFHGKVIQEAPAPEALIMRQGLGKLTFGLIIGGGALILLAGAFAAAYFSFIRPAKLTHTPIDLQKDKGKTYTLSVIPFQCRVYAGDILEVPFPGRSLSLTVADTLGTLKLETPIGFQLVELGEELDLDIDGQSGTDLVVFLSDISKTDAGLGAEVRMFLKSGFGSLPETSLTATDAAALDTVVPVKAGAKQTVILQDNRPYPFTISAAFRAGCLYRYKSDQKDTIETFFISGDTLVMQAQNGLRLWMSNSNAVRMQLIADGKSFELEIGRAGQVLVQDVRWLKEADGVYKLAVIEVD